MYFETISSWMDGSIQTMDNLLFEGKRCLCFVPISRIISPLPISLGGQCPWSASLLSSSCSQTPLGWCHCQMLCWTFLLLHPEPHQTDLPKNQQAEKAMVNLTISCWFFPLCTTNGSLEQVPPSTHFWKELCKCFSLMQPIWGAALPQFAVTVPNGSEGKGEVCTMWSLSYLLPPPATLLDWAKCLLFAWLGCKSWRLCRSEESLQS